MNNNHQENRENLRESSKGTSDFLAMSIAMFQVLAPYVIGSVIILVLVGFLFTWFIR